MCGRTRPRGEQLAQLRLVALEGLGLVGGEAEELEPADLDALEQHEVERDPGDLAGRVADGDEPAAVAQRAQRRLGQIATHRIDDDVGAGGQRLSERGAQVAAVVVDHPGGAVLPPRPSSFSSDDATAVTVAPSARRAARPPGPLRRRRRARRARRRAAARAVERRTWIAVRWATPAAAASASSSPSGTGTEGAAAHDHLLGEGADEPGAGHPVADRQPAARRRPPPSTTPANSLPGTNGERRRPSGTCPPRAARRGSSPPRRARAPGPGRGRPQARAVLDRDDLGRAVARGTPRPRTDGQRVVGGLGQVGGVPHEVEHDRAEGLQLARRRRRAGSPARARRRASTWRGPRSSRCRRPGGPTPRRSGPAPSTCDGMPVMST